MKSTLTVINRPLVRLAVTSGPPILPSQERLDMVRRRFAHPFWNSVRDKAVRKVFELRRQNFFATAMLPMSEPEYTGATRLLKQPRFAQQLAPALGYPAADPVAAPLSPRLHG